MAFENRCHYVILWPMKHAANFLLLAIIIISFSCSNSQSRSSEPGPWIVPQAGAKYDSNILSTLKNMDTLPPAATTSAQPAAAVQQNFTSNDSAAILLAKGLNPPHGATGHRCDLKVGEPLTAKPEPKTNTGLNPAHGQPGHRCDIAVGAPLNSKPVSTTTPPANVVQTDTARSNANAAVTDTVKN